METMTDFDTPELEPIARPPRRGPYQAEYRVRAHGMCLGEVRTGPFGYLAYDEATGRWVGPFKRLRDVSRFFLRPTCPHAPVPAEQYAGTPVTKGPRAFLSSRALAKELRAEPVQVELLPYHDPAPE
jgi:hypothetical protein